MSDEYLIWGILALVLGYIVYSFFTGTKEWFVTPPTCTWKDPVLSPIPSRGISDFLSSFEYTTSNAAKVACSSDPACKGLIGETRSVNVSDGSTRGYHSESRTVWKLTNTSTRVTNTDINLSFIEKDTCSGGNVPVATCQFNAVGESNYKPAPGTNTLGTQFRTLLEAKVGCSTDNRCDGIDSRPDGFFYLSDSTVLTAASGHTFYYKGQCPIVTDPYANNRNVINANRARDARDNENTAAANWLASNTPDTRAEFIADWRRLYGNAPLPMDIMGYDEAGQYDSGVRTIPPVGPPPHAATSTLGNISGMSGMTGSWQEGPKDNDRGSNANWASPGDAYILKSSLVPCTCTTHSMGCERHAGGRQESFAPGDLDNGGGNLQYKTEPQSALMRPFSQAFQNQGEPIGYLNSFSAFA